MALQATYENVHQQVKIHLQSKLCMDFYLLLERPGILFVRRHLAIQVIPAYAFRQLYAVNSRRAV